MKIKFSSFEFTLLLLYLLHYQQATAQLHKRQKTDNVVAEMQVLCRSDAIVLKVNTNAPFNGMVYAKDAPNSSNCMSEFNASTNMTFRLPLKSCGTLFSEIDDGIEYFNTIVVQPHMRLMTNQGKGYHVRCKYQTRERTIANTHFNVSASFVMSNNAQTTTTPLTATASMPSCTMKIFRSGRDDVAEAVKIGDKLIMVIEIDQQDMYGMKITNCVVRDGMNLAEQQLIDDLGCPIDDNIMPKFEYTNNSTRAAVSFPAHKFPHTSSVYYQCNVRLCINNGGCQLAECNVTPPGGAGGGGVSSNISNSNQVPRKKRMTQQLGGGGVRNADQYRVGNMTTKELMPPPLPTASALVAPKQHKQINKQQDNKGAAGAQDGGSMSFDVYSGLYVSDVDIAESGSSDSNTQQVMPARRTQWDQSNQQEEICLAPGQICLVVLMGSVISVGVVLLISCQVGGFFGAREQQVGVGSGKLFSTNSSCSSLAGSSLPHSLSTTNHRRIVGLSGVGGGLAGGQHCRSHESSRLSGQFYQ